MGPVRQPSRLVELELAMINDRSEAACPVI